jgi:hypothetical protein
VLLCCTYVNVVRVCVCVCVLMYASGMWIYVCVCVCVCVCVDTVTTSGVLLLLNACMGKLYFYGTHVCKHVHVHTHMHIHMLVRLCDNNRSVCSIYLLKDHSLDQMQLTVCDCACVV